MSEYQMLVNGHWTSGSASMPVLTPATEQVITEVHVASENEVREALEGAARGQRDWSRCVQRLELSARG